MNRGKKCLKLTCPRKEQNAGFCKMHYPIFMAEMGLPIGKVSCNRAVEHLLKVRETGMGLPRAAELAGVAKITLWRILSKRPLIHASTEAKILSIPLDFMTYASNGYRITKVGTQRRIQGLQALGYTAEDIAERVGLTKDSILEISSGKQPGVKLGTARRVAEVFSQLETTKGPSRASAGRAKVKGYALPLQWDENQIDNPDAVPHDCKRTPKSTATTKEQRLADAAELISYGVSPDEAAQRLGVTPDTFMEYMRRAS